MALFEIGVEMGDEAGGRAGKRDRLEYSTLEDDDDDDDTYRLEELEDCTYEAFWVGERG